MGVPPRQRGRRLISSQPVIQQRLRSGSGNLTNRNGSKRLERSHSHQTVAIGEFGCLLFIIRPLSRIPSHFISSGCSRWDNPEAKEQNCPWALMMAFRRFSPSRFFFFSHTFPLVNYVALGHVFPPLRLESCSGLGGDSSGGSPSGPPSCTLARP